MSHLLLWPIVLPLLGAALALFLEHRRFGWAARRWAAWGMLALQGVAVAAVVARVAGGEVVAYLLGDWPARLGIALMADRLSGWMLAVTWPWAWPACCTPAAAGTGARRISMPSSSCS